MIDVSTLTARFPLATNHTELAIALFLIDELMPDLTVASVVGKVITTTDEEGAETTATIRETVSGLLDLLDQLDESCA